MAEQITNGGMQYVPQLAAVQQIVYLDFDGELTSYNGEILSLENVEVQNSSLTEERINNIVTALNEKYASQNVIFVTECPQTGEYSTIFIGKTTAFDSCGNFTGVAETIDTDNQNKSDNAFVTLDATATNTQIIATIAHETDHLLGRLNHGGEGINAYAADESYVTVSAQEILNVRGRVVKNITVLNHGIIASGSSGYSPGIQHLGSEAAYISEISGGVVTGVVSGFDFSHYCGYNSPWGNMAYLNIGAGGKAIDTTLRSGANLHLAPGASAENTIVEYGGYLNVSSGATAANISFDSGAFISLDGNYNGFYAKTSGHIDYIDADGVIVNISGCEIAANGNYLGDASIAVKGSAADIILSGAFNYQTYSYAYMTLLEGADAQNIVINNCGRLHVTDNASVTELTLNPGAGVFVSSGGSVVDLLVNSGAGVFVSSGGSAANVQLMPGANVTVYSGGYAAFAFDPWWNVNRITASRGAVVEYLERDANVYYGGSNSGLISKTDMIDDLQITDRNSAVIYSGGTANNTAINKLGYLYISSGGTANNTMVNSSGYLYVYSGGTANSTIVNSDGYLYISSGGTANSTTVNSGGNLYISSGGTANSTTVNSGGNLYISSGGAADGITVNSAGGLTIAGGTATNIIWTPCVGNISVAYGANFTFASNYTGIYIGSDNQLLSHTQEITGETFSTGSMYVMENGTVNSLTVNSEGSVFVFSGGLANSTTVSATLYVYSGGIADNTAVAGKLYVAGTANSTTVNRGTLYVDSGGTANCTTLNSYGYLFVYSGGTANCTTLNSDGCLWISSDGTVNCTTVNSSGRLTVSSGGTANSTTVNYSGSLFVYSGGTANSTTVNHSGCLYVESGGTATITFDPWRRGTVYSSRGAVVKYLEHDANVYYGGGGGLLSKADIMDDLQITYGNSAIIYSGGTANNTTINGYGYLYVSSGGTANNTMVDLSAYLYVSSGGTMNDTTLNNSGRGYVDGTANNTIVNSGGELYVHSGGTASIIYNPWQGRVYSSEEAVVEYLERDANVYYGGRSGLISKADILDDLQITYGNSAIIYNGGTANSTTVNSGGILYTSSGGTANSTTVINEGNLIVFSGGTADNTTVDSYGRFHVSGGTANNTTLDENGFLYVSSGGTADNTTVNSSGRLTVSSGGTANSTTVNSGGELDVSSGGTANNATVNLGGSLFIANNGTAALIKENGGIVSIANGASVTFLANTISGLVLSNTSATLHEETTANETIVNESGCLDILGGTANSTTVNSSGRLYVSHDGTANNTTVNSGGRLSIYSDCTANNTTVNSGGLLYIEGTHKGSLQINSGAVVSAYYTAAIDFTVADRTTEDGFLINDLSLISGTPTYTITVSADQAAGTYKLAQGAASFNGTVSIGDNTTTYGRLDVTQGITYHGNYYNLVKNEDSLDLVITVLPPDLSISNLKVLSEETAEQEFVVTVAFSVTNHGSAVNESVVYIYDGTTKLGEVTVSALEAGGTFDGIFTIEAGTLSAGSHWIYVVADSTNVIAESDEDNNSARYSVGLAHKDFAEPNDTFETAYDLGSVTDSITIDDLNITAGDWDYFKFTITAEDTYSFTTMGEAGDTILYLYDAEGTELMYDDDGGDGNFSKVTTVLTEGTYYLLVNGYYGDSTVENYSLNCSVGGGIDEGDFAESNDTFETAYELENILGGFPPIDGLNLTVGDIDFFTFTVMDAGEYVFTAAGIMGGIILSLYDAAGNHVPGNDDGSVGDLTQLSATLAAGTYYLKVQGDNNLYTVNYSLGCEYNMIIGDITEPNDTFETAFDLGSVTGEMTLEGLSLTAGDIDYFTFTVTDAGEYIFTTMGTEGDTLLYLYDAEGTLLMFNDDGAEGNFSQISTTLAEGIYYLKVNCYSASATVENYSLNCSAGGGIIEGDFAELNNSFDTAYDVGIVNENMMLENLSITAGDVDFFKFRANTWTEYVFTTMGTTGDTLLYLYDAEGNRLMYNDDGGTGYFSQISTTLAEGTYYLKVVSYMSDPIDDYALNFSATEVVPGISDLVYLDGTCSWSCTPSGAENVIEFSNDSFETSAKITLYDTAIDIYGLPAGTWQWQVGLTNGDERQIGTDIVSTNESSAPQHFDAAADYNNFDLFFATADGVWGNAYAVQHQGVWDGGATNFWEGTGEIVVLAGKNRFIDTFTGSNYCYNTLLLSDSANGDAFVLDDIFSPTALEEQAARFSGIDEIRAGAGDDVIDMTSQRFYCSSYGMIVYGGAGNDTIWASNNNNILFGDAGNDRIVGGVHSDVIAGGAGNDAMHGGGGDDIFTFGADWGNDTVEQLSSGSVTLWFETGSEDNWNADTQTYSDGTNSVTVKGTADITLVFGNTEDIAEGAFLEAASEKVFEDKDSGFIA